MGAQVEQPIQSGGKVHFHNETMPGFPLRDNPSEQVDRSHIWGLLTERASAGEEQPVFSIGLQR